jgi:hypothetical protein
MAGLCKGMDWIGLAQDRDRWRAFVKTVKKYIKIFRSGHSYVCPNVVIVPNKCKFLIVRNIG